MCAENLEDLAREGARHVNQSGVRVSKVGQQVGEGEQGGSTSGRG